MKDNEERRSKWDICADIIEAVAEEPLTFQKLCAEANLNFSMGRDYVDDLKSGGLVEEDDKIKPTEKGLEFLQKYDELLDMVEGYNG